MKHTLRISVSKKPISGGIVSCRSVSVRERFLRFLFGDKQQLTVIVPGDSVEELAISEVTCDRHTDAGGREEVSDHAATDHAHQGEAVQLPV